MGALAGTRLGGLGARAPAQKPSRSATLRVCAQAKGQNGPERPQAATTSVGRMAHGALERSAFWQNQNQPKRQPPNTVSPIRA